MSKIWFGLDINPATAEVASALRRAQMADRLGFDLITAQDHPYNRHFLDTWTLLAVLAGYTERVRLGTNVANVPLRAPALLAKQAASLDVLTGGRMELGIGAGAFWRGIAALGGPERAPREAFLAFREALHIIRGMWDSAGQSFSFSGDFYTVNGVVPGPAPVGAGRIWVGAGGPKMLELTGQLADGIWTSVAYVLPERLGWVNELIDAGAAQADRAPTAIRRGYNVMGSLHTSNGAGRLSEQGIHGDSIYWIETLTRLHADHRQDAFVFWPSGDDTEMQIERFAHEVIPAIRERFPT
ncbi:MAG: LLM class flavin-dependent oxidoreductase [Chloroflexi bacterium]|nr:LLM class flavin-dependent oxidoreductase [Chloroflexota bacterium]